MTGFRKRKEERRKEGQKRVEEMGRKKRLEDRAAVSPPSFPASHPPTLPPSSSWNRRGAIGALCCGLVLGAQGTLQLLWVWVPCTSARVWSAQGARGLVWWIRLAKVDPCPGATQECTLVHRSSYL